MPCVLREFLQNTNIAEVLLLLPDAGVSEPKKLVRILIGNRNGNDTAVGDVHVERPVPGLEVE